MDQSEAEQFIVQFIRTRPTLAELNLWGVLEDYIYTHHQAALRTRSPDSLRGEFALPFLAAAWDLALLGVLRAGTVDWPPGGDFDGTKYAITAFGHRWVAEGAEDVFVPIGSDTFVDLLRPYAEFGQAFLERAKEAARCWKVHAYLACCVMCGAAAEAVLVAAATAKTGNQPKVLETYNSKSGRRKVETLLTGQARAEIKESLAPLFGLVKYWRDEASHGATSGIGQAAARTSSSSLPLFPLCPSQLARNYRAITAA